MVEKLFYLEEIRKLSEKKHKGEIYKILKINYDSKNFFVRLPKEIVEHAKIKKEDRMIVSLDTNKSPKEVVINCKLIRN